MLFIHADHFEYEVKSKAVKHPEDIIDEKMKESTDEVLVIFCTIEKEDEKNPEVIVNKAVENIEDVAKKLDVRNLVIYPYAHLSSSLGSGDTAIPILKNLEKNLS